MTLTLRTVLIVLTLALYCCDACYVYPPDIKDPCENMKCNFGAECVPALDGLSASCQCPDRCDSYGDTVDSTPVCGNDGKDYKNKCEMRKAACNKMKEIGVKYLGNCGKYFCAFLNIKNRG